MAIAIDRTLRRSFLRVPEVIRECSGINVFVGANAITWTPPTVSHLFKGVMNSYRNNVENHH